MTRGRAKGKKSAPRPGMNPVAETRDHYRYFLAIPTRWIDNDMFGHVNNVAYYRFFETVIVRFTMDEAGLDIRTCDLVPYAVESMCRYLKPMSYPDTIEAGLRVARLGSTSVTYELGLFVEGSREPAATGHIVQVFVGRKSERPEPIPPSIRAVFARFHI